MSNQVMNVLATSIAVLGLGVSSSVAQACPFVSEPVGEPPYVIELDDTGGAKSFKMYVDGLGEEDDCSYAEGWISDGHLYGSRNIYVCGAREGLLSFVSSVENGPIDMIVLDGMSFYERCD